MVERIVTVALMFILGAAYASAQPMAITDIRHLAGKWSGWGTAPSGGAFPIEVAVNSDGTYTSMMGATRGQGRFTTVDCKITGVTTEGHLSGPAGAGSAAVSHATVGAQGGTQVLSGSGRSDAGPFNYALTKQ